jgi:hypothetical protein
VAADRVRRALIQAVALVSEHPVTAFGFVPPQRHLPERTRRSSDRRSLSEEECENFSSNNPAHARSSQEIC